MFSGKYAWLILCLFILQGIGVMALAGEHIYFAGSHSGRCDIATSLFVHGEWSRERMLVWCPFGPEQDEIFNPKHVK